jgi:hypothetical protein
LPAVRSTTCRTQHYKNEHRKGKPRAHDRLSVLLKSDCILRS